MAEFITRQEGQRLVIKAKGDLTIAEGPSLVAVLREAVGEGVQAEIDLHEVTDLDLTALQVFCAAHRSAIRGSGSLHFSGCSAILRERAKIAGFLREHGCAQNPAGTCLWTEINGR